MPISQLWCLSAVPENLEKTVLNDFTFALNAAKEHFQNNRDKLQAFRNWCNDPESFLINTEIYDIKRRYKCIYPADPWSWQIYQSLFSIDEFDRLFYKYSRTDTDSQYKLDETTVIKPVMTQGDTATSILYYSLGPNKARLLPGFFGNFFIQHNHALSELNQILQIIHSSDRSQIIRRGEKWTSGYNDADKVEDVINSIPFALQKAIEQHCGLLGLQITVG
jgi:hypothetical protein